jgi:Na+/melibiose symporter-like transporter
MLVAVGVAVSTVMVVVLMSVLVCGCGGGRRGNRYWMWTWIVRVVGVEAVDMCVRDCEDVEVKQTRWRRGIASSRQGGVLEYRLWTECDTRAKHHDATTSSKSNADTTNKRKLTNTCPN